VIRGLIAVDKELGGKDGNGRLAGTSNVIGRTSLPFFLLKTLTLFDIPIKRSISLKSSVSTR
jgi:hypothetical protein